jgi:hypothetical protein
MDGYDVVGVVVAAVDVADGLVDRDAIAGAEEGAGATMVGGRNEAIGRDFRAWQAEFVLARYDDLEWEKLDLNFFWIRFKIVR